jgi:hypothetical protein
VSVSGTLTGTATFEHQVRFISDQPSKYLLSGASGVIRNLGAVTAVGTLRGTGFVARGTPTLWIAVTNAAGTVSIGGVGPLVGGFALP